MPRRDKRVVIREDPKNEKRVVVKENVGYYPQLPRWRFAKMEFCEPFGLHKLRDGDLEEIQKCLGDLERMTWKTIIQERWTNITIFRLRNFVQKLGSACVNWNWKISTKCFVYA